MMTEMEEDPSPMAADVTSIDIGNPKLTTYATPSYGYSSIEITLQCRIGKPPHGHRSLG